jgi:hypothetical protein
MALSAETTSKLADALVSEVIDTIHEDERYVTFLHEVIPDAIHSKLGNLDDDLLFDLSMCIMDRMMLRVAI